MSIKYTVEIPDILVKLVGPQNIRTEIEESVREYFEEWARPELIKKIKVIKPRGGKDE
jgi:hypothetical protein